MDKNLTLIAVARHPGEIYKLNGRKLGGVHFEEDCEGETCVIHKPTDHHMREWSLHWRNDREIFERICEHGIGHPDPDQFEFWAAMMTPEAAEAEGIHGCDGCCWDGKS